MLFNIYNIYFIDTFFVLIKNLGKLLTQGTSFGSITLLN